MIQRRAKIIRLGNAAIETINAMRADFKQQPLCAECDHPFAPAHPDGGECQYPRCRCKRFVSARDLGEWSQALMAPLDLSLVVPPLSSSPVASAVAQEASAGATGSSQNTTGAAPDQAPAPSPAGAVPAVPSPSSPAPGSSPTEAASHVAHGQPLAPVAPLTPASPSTGQAADPTPGSDPAASGPHLPARTPTYYDFAAEAMSAFEQAEAMSAFEQAEADIAFYEEQGERRAFHILTRAHLEWFVRLLTEIASQRARVREQAAKIDAQFAGQLRYLARRFGPEVEPLVDAMLAASKPKKRSVDLFAARIGYRTTPAAPTVADRAAARAWALAQDDAEQFGTYGYTLDARKVIAHVKDTGEVVPGVEQREARESLYLKAPDGAHIDLTALAAPPAIESHENEEE